MKGPFKLSRLLQEVTGLVNVISDKIDTNESCAIIIVKLLSVIIDLNKKNACASCSNIVF